LNVPLAAPGAPPGGAGVVVVGLFAALLAPALNTVAPTAPPATIDAATMAAMVRLRTICMCTTFLARGWTVKPPYSKASTPSRRRIR
jgi:hypothetical protein